MSLTEPSEGEESGLESLEDSSKDNSMVEGGSKGKTLLGHPRRRAERRREDAEGGWVSFPIRDRNTLGSADGSSDS